MSGASDSSGSPPGAPLGRRFLLGGVYVGFASWGTTAFRFVANLLLARLLGPEILGFYAFVFSVNEFLNMVGAFSMGLAIIQAPRTSQQHEDTAFSIAGLLGLAGLVGAAMVAPLLYAHRSPLAALFIVLLGAARLLMLLGSIPLAKLERALRYSTVAGVNVTAGVLPSVAALALAWLGAGVWSLLAQDLLIAVTILGLALPLSGYRYRRAFDRGIASQLMAFGRPMFVSRSLEITLQRIDRLLVGAFLGDRRLGLYHQSRVLAEVGLTVINPLNRLVFNLYARLQEDPARLARAFGLINYFAVRLMFAGASTLLVYPEPTIQLLLGERWLDATPILRALGLYAALLPVLENAKQLLYARGEARRAVTLRLVQLALLAVGLTYAIGLDSVVLAAASLAGVTVVGTIVAFAYSRDVIRGLVLRILIAPVVVITLTTLSLQAPPVAARLAELPIPVLPFLPPLLYAVLTLATDRTQLFGNLRTLRDLLRAPASQGGSPAPGDERASRG